MPELQKQNIESDSEERDSFKPELGQINLVKLFPISDIFATREYKRASQQEKEQALINYAVQWETNRQIDPNYNPSEGELTYEELRKQALQEDHSTLKAIASIPFRAVKGFVRRPGEMAIDMFAGKEANKAIEEIELNSTNLNRFGLYGENFDPNSFAAQPFMADMKEMAAEQGVSLMTGDDGQTYVDVNTPDFEQFVRNNLPEEARQNIVNIKSALRDLNYAENIYDAKRENVQDTFFARTFADQFNIGETWETFFKDDDQRNFAHKVARAVTSSTSRIAGQIGEGIGDFAVIAATHAATKGVLKIPAAGFGATAARSEKIAKAATKAKATVQSARGKAGEKIAVYDKSGKIKGSVKYFEAQVRNPANLTGSAVLAKAQSDAVLMQQLQDGASLEEAQDIATTVFGTTFLLEKIGADAVMPTLLQAGGTRGIANLIAERAAKKLEKSGRRGVANHANHLAASVEVFTEIAQSLAQRGAIVGFREDIEGAEEKSEEFFKGLANELADVIFASYGSSRAISKATGGSGKITEDLLSNIAEQARATNVQEQGIGDTRTLDIILDEDVNVEDMVAEQIDPEKFVEGAVITNSGRTGFASAKREKSTGGIGSKKSYVYDVVFYKQDGTTTDPRQISADQLKRPVNFTLKWDNDPMLTQLNQSEEELTKHQKVLNEFVLPKLGEKPNRTGFTGSAKIISHREFYDTRNENNEHHAAQLAVAKMLIPNREIILISDPSSENASSGSHVAIEQLDAEGNLDKSVSGDYVLVRVESIRDDRLDLMRTISHEVWHQFWRSDKKKAKDLVTKIDKQSPEVSKIIDRYLKSYGAKRNEDGTIPEKFQDVIDDELGAHITEHMFIQRDFWKNLKEADEDSFNAIAKSLGDSAGNFVKALSAHPAAMQTGIMSSLADVNDAMTIARQVLNTTQIDDSIQNTINKTVEDLATASEQDAEVLINEMYGEMNLPTSVMAQLVDVAKTEVKRFRSQLKRKANSQFIGDVSQDNFSISENIKAMQDLVEPKAKVVLDKSNESIAQQQILNQLKLASKDVDLNINDSSEVFYSDNAYISKLLDTIDAETKKMGTLPVEEKSLRSRYQVALKQVGAQSINDIVSSSDQEVAARKALQFHNTMRDYIVSLIQQSQQLSNQEFTESRSESKLSRTVEGLRRDATREERENAILSRDQENEKREEADQQLRSAQIELAEEILLNFARKPSSLEPTADELAMVESAYKIFEETGEPLPSTKTDTVQLDEGASVEQSAQELNEIEKDEIKTPGDQKVSMVKEQASDTDEKARVNTEEFANAEYSTLVKRITQLVRNAKQKIAKANPQIKNKQIRLANQIYTRMDKGFKYELSDVIWEAKQNKQVIDVVADTNTGIIDIKPISLTNNNDYNTSELLDNYGKKFHLEIRSRLAEEEIEVSKAFEDLQDFVDDPVIDGEYVKLKDIEKEAKNLMDEFRATGDVNLFDRTLGSVELGSEESQLSLVIQQSFNNIIDRLKEKNGSKKLSMSQIDALAKYNAERAPMSTMFKMLNDSERWFAVSATDTGYSAAYKSSLARHAIDLAHRYEQDMRNSGNQEFADTFNNTFQILSNMNEDFGSILSYAFMARKNPKLNSVEQRKLALIGLLNTFDPKVRARLIEMQNRGEALEAIINELSPFINSGRNAVREALAGEGFNVDDIDAFVQQTSDPKNFFLASRVVAQVNGRIGDMVYEYFISSILSGIPTGLINLMAIPEMTYNVFVREGVKAYMGDALRQMGYDSTALTRDTHKKLVKNFFKYQRDALSAAMTSFKVQNSLFDSAFGEENMKDMLLYGDRSSIPDNLRILNHQHNRRMDYIVSHFGPMSAIGKQAEKFRIPVEKIGVREVDLVNQNSEKINAANSWIQNNSLGSTIRTPLRVLLFADEYVRQLSFLSMQDAQAFKEALDLKEQAKKDGKSFNFDQKIEEIKQDLTSDTSKNAFAFAQQNAFRDKPREGSVSEKILAFAVMARQPIQSFRSKKGKEGKSDGGFITDDASLNRTQKALGHYVIPFLFTPFSLLLNAIFRKTPLSLYEVYSLNKETIKKNKQQNVKRQVAEKEIIDEQGFITESQKNEIAEKFEYDMSELNVDGLADSVMNATMIILGLSLIGGEDDDDKPISITGSGKFSSIGYKGAKQERSFTSQKDLAPRKSIRFNFLGDDTWYDISRMDPFVTPLLLFTDIRDAMDDAGGVNAEFAVEMLPKIGTLVKEKSYLEGLSNLIDLGENFMSPKRGPFAGERLTESFEQFAADLTASFVPNIIKQFNTYKNPNEFNYDNVKGFTPRLNAKLDFENETRSLAIDWLGKEVIRGGAPDGMSWMYAFISPFKKKEVERMRDPNLIYHRWNLMNPNDTQYPTSNYPYTDDFHKSSPKTWESFLRKKGALTERYVKNYIKRNPSVLLNPTKRDMEIIKNAISTAGSDTKKIMINEGLLVQLSRRVKVGERSVLYMTPSEARNFMAEYPEWSLRRGRM